MYQQSWTYGYYRMLIVQALTRPLIKMLQQLQFGKITDISSYGADGRKVYAIGEQVYKDLTADTTNVEAAITVNGQVNEANQKESLENGPKNEVYLAKGSAITMTFNTKREVQLG